MKVVTDNGLILQAGKGLIKVNGRPLQLVQPEILRFKVRLKSSSVDTRMRFPWQFDGASRRTGRKA
jgi:ribosomal protein S9